MVTKLVSDPSAFSGDAAVEQDVARGPQMSDQARKLVTYGT